MNSVNGKMDGERNDGLKEPLLQHLNGVAIDMPQQVDQGSKKLRTVKFKIREIKCASCATSIESVMDNLNGVESAVVSPLEGQAVVKFVPEIVTVSGLHELIFFLHDILLSELVHHRLV